MVRRIVIRIIRTQEDVITADLRIREIVLQADSTKTETMHPAQNLKGIVLRSTDREDLTEVKDPAIIIRMTDEDSVMVPEIIRDILSEMTSSFMWVSPVPQALLDRYGLITKPCKENTKTYKDVLIYKKDYKFSPLDDMFINELMKVKNQFR